MPNIRGPELLILVLVVVLLFGAKRLPDAARSVGRSLRIFKAETKGLVEGETSTDTAPTTAAAPAAPALPPAQPETAMPTPMPPVDAAAADNALAPQSDGTPSSLAHQPPSQA